ncbi:N-acetylneuraminate synthase family protein [Chloroflexota bacterium]
MKKIKIGNRYIGEDEPTYIMAEIGANFDGNLEQAKKMVDLAKEVGADAAKFQSFMPEKIVARKGFENKMSFQAKWKKPVYDVYSDAMFPREWHKEIAEYCRKKGMDFISAPYDKEAVDLLEQIGVPAYKIGSGDVTFLSLVRYIAEKGKPIIMGTGACTLGEIEEAVSTIRNTGNQNIVLLQCVTNYPSPFEHANIRAMVAMAETFDVMVGYSDHTPGSVVPLGAVALGACVIEKHFTFDKTREGPDHPFAMDVPEMTSMVRDIRLLEQAMGSKKKEITPSEAETQIVQRRSLFSRVDIPAGIVITEDMIEVLRPQTGILPGSISLVVGRKAKVDISEGEPITWDKI